MHETGSACNGFIVIMLVRRFGQRQTIVKKQLNAQLPEIVGALEIFFFAGERMAVDHQCDHGCDRSRFHESIGVRCRS